MGKRMLRIPKLRWEDCVKKDVKKNNQKSIGEKHHKTGIYNIWQVLCLVWS